MIYLAIAAAVLFLLLVIGLWIIYDMAFAAKRSRHPAPDEMPPKDDEQYAPYGRMLRENVRRLDAVPYESVEITSFDGLRLRGRFYDAGKSAPVAILFHGYRSTALRDASGGAPYCLKNGFSVLLVDQRSHGLSDGRTITFGVKERRDCLKWIEYINERTGAEAPVLLMGVSMGAATVLMAADLELPDNVRCIMADCPYSSPEEIICRVAGKMGLPAGMLKPFIRASARIFGGFALNESTAVRAVRNCRIPVLLIHGDDDRFVPCDMSRRIHAANPEMITLVEIPSAGHGIAYYVDTEAYEKAVAEAWKAAIY